MYVSDTHALLWYLTDDVRLGKEAKVLFNKADRGEITIFVPTIVLAESLFVAEKHHVDIEFVEILKNIRKSLNYVIYPLTVQVVVKCQELKTIPEIHDRIIVATAKLLNSKILTKDGEIADSMIVEMVW